MSAEPVQASDVSVVKKWLAKHPKRAVALALSAKDAEGAVVELGSWECAELPPERAVDLVEAVEQFTQVHDRDCIASVVWADAKGKVLQTRLLRRKYKRDAEENEHGPMSGSAMDQAQQAQKALKEMTTLFLTGIRDAMTSTNRLAGQALDMMSNVMQATARDREELAVLREQIQEIVVTQAEEVANAADAQAKKDAEEKQPSPVEIAVGMGINALMANAGANGTPKQPPAAGS